MAQRAVDRERIGRDVGLEALRQHRLIDVARGDALLDRAHAGFEDLLRQVRADLGRRPLAGLGLRQPALELALEELNLGARELVERAQILVGGDARVGDDQDPVLHVIERQHGIEQHEARIVFRVGVRRSSVRAAVACAQAFSSAGSKIGDAS